MENTVKFIEIDGVKKSIVDSAAQNAHLLRNRDFGRFIINQRNIAANTPFSTVGAYFIDRWILDNGTATITPNGLQVNGAIIQKMEHSFDFEDAPNLLKMYSGTAKVSYNEATKTFLLESNGGIISRIYDPPADYAEELIKCQRYFRRLSLSNVNHLGIPINWDNRRGLLQINLSPEMRSNPAIKISNNPSFTCLPGFGITCSLLPLSPKKGSAAFYVSTDETTYTDFFLTPKFVKFTDDTTYIDFDAEL